MTFSITKPAGKIEIKPTICSCCYPGKKPSGQRQHAFVETLWWKAGHGIWTKDLRTFEFIRTLAIGSETVAEFLEKMEKPT